jgi:hypothetical protein
MPLHKAVVETKDLVGWNFSTGRFADIALVARDFVTVPRHISREIFQSQPAGSLSSSTEESRCSSGWLASSIYPFRLFRLLQEIGFLPVSTTARTYISMASVSSLDKDLARLRRSKYTGEAATEVNAWISSSLDEKLPTGDLMDVLKDGTILCRYNFFFFLFFFDVICK